MLAELLLLRNSCSFIQIFKRVPSKRKAFDLAWTSIYRDNLTSNEITINSVLGTNTLLVSLLRLLRQTTPNISGGHRCASWPGNKYPDYGISRGFPQQLKANAIIRYQIAPRSLSPKSVPVNHLLHSTLYSLRY
jgi:hypothetical protein